MKVLLMLVVLLACSAFTARGKHPRKFAPGLEGSTVGNLTAHGCYSAWGSSGTPKASMDRCCLLRACCYAKLAARRCRVGPIQPPSVPQAGIPTCRSGTWCQRGACRCERAAQLCRMRSRGLLRRRSKCGDELGGVEAKGLFAKPRPG
ncbi:basic phospholipase A2 A-like [Grus americana]|uniref:basic phospholipase A2 A-like n=1 Tax=Grus americana TaxID=9117 RepID=UPI002407F948|nr:basic phospholipase A2 A-like [Grus americana]